MIKGLIHEAQLKLQVKTGFSGGIVVAAAIAAVAAVMVFVFLCVAAFLWLEQYYGGVTAGLIMAAAFLVVAVLALIAFMLIRRGNIERARQELVLAAAARKQSALFDPAMLLTGIQLMKGMGLKRLMPIAGAALLAAGIGRELAARSNRSSEPKN